jgi:AcrR family transcriptional regulator
MGARAGLDKAAVVRAATEIADAEGLNAVTLARLAATLGVRPPSLYNHVAGQEGLQHELALHGVQELGRRLGRAAMGKASDDALLAVADAYRAFAHEHPGLYAATQRAPDPADPAVVAAAGGVLEVVLAVLAGYGLEGEDALHATRGLRSLVHGFVSLEAGGGFGLPLDLDASFRWLLAVFIAGLHSRPGSSAPPG